MKTRTTLKIIAVLVFVTGAVTFVNASRKKARVPVAEAFVATSLILRAQNGDTPEVTGLRVKVVAANGFFKQITFRKEDKEVHKPTSTKYMDDIATYILDGGRLQFEHLSDGDFDRDRHAQSAEWVTKNTLFAGKQSILGLDSNLTHQSLNDGWVKQAYSIRTRGTPLLVHEHRDDEGDFIEQAISVQFRDVPDDEVRLPDLPVSFELVKRAEAGLATNPQNAEIVKRMMEEREVAVQRLRTRGTRVE